MWQYKTGDVNSIRTEENILLWCCSLHYSDSVFDLQVFSLQSICQTNMNVKTGKKIANKIYFVSRVMHYSVEINVFISVCIVSLSGNYW